MNPNFVLVYPMFAMVCLTFLVATTMLFSRINGARRRDVHIKYFKLMSGDAPEYMMKPARHFINLFETPVLFYAVCLTAMVTQTSNGALQIMAWIFFALRVIHAAIHLGPNKVLPRMAAFLTSFGVLMAMWITVIIRLSDW